jgi:hypothetical protein
MLTTVLLSLVAAPLPDQDPLAAELPPAIPWDGVSRAAVVPADDPWITPCEASGLTASPSYDETVAWVRRLCAAAPELELLSIGTSDEGRDIWMVAASREGGHTPAAFAANGRPTLLAHAGIHSGEIDGKDAGMMLLRDMTVGARRSELLDGANFLFVPILNADGHERSSRYGRINQRGPTEMGWRTNARNLNLNRDFTKLDTPGVRAVVGVLNDWDPQLYLDLHVTDGIDYQYDITYGFVGAHGYSPASAGWMRDVLKVQVDTALRAGGHIPGPLIFARDDTNPSAGIVDWTGSARFSNCYGDLRHTPTVLVENHSLKPYDQRVLGTYVLLEATLRALAGEAEPLRAAIASDRARRPAELPTAWRPSAPEPMEFLGVAHEVSDSKISGARVVAWLGRPETVELPVLRFNSPAATVARARAYWVPPTYPDVIERLALHGVELETLAAPRTVRVERLRLVDATLGTQSFEGRVTVTAGVEAEVQTRAYPAGSVRVTTDQPLGDLAVLLLEPAYQDSFFQWGFFLACLQRTEYVEGYVMEPLAERMLAADAALKAAFEERLASDEDFAADPRARLEWFYRRTPYYDAEHQLYPVARELTDTE